MVAPFPFLNFSTIHLCCVKNVWAGQAGVFAFGWKMYLSATSGIMAAMAGEAAARGT